MNGSLAAALIILTSFCFMSACGNFREIADDDRAIADLKEIRNAQMKFRADTGRYGSIPDLVGGGYLGDRLGDGADVGYLFKVKSQGLHYSVSVIPGPERSQKDLGRTEQVSFYMDESGIIRMGVTPGVPADANSSAIRNKYDPEQ